MRDNESKARTPKLRFPEFRSSWKLRAIAPHIEECASRVPASTSLPVYTSSRSGLKPQEDYYGGKVVANNGEYGVVPAGCFVYRHMSDDGIFAFNFNDTGRDIAVSKEYPVFKAVALDSRFLLAQLNHSPDFKAFALSQKAGGTRTRLYLSKLRTWKTLLPSLREQEKIADCLTSLDELIAAQGRKLEALKAHKKGLMQQLFPSEGETLPRLRFPQFRHEGKWEAKLLRQIAVYENGKAYEQDIAERGKYVVVNSKFISSDGAVRKYSNAEHCLAEAGDVLMVLSDLPKGRALAKCYFVASDASHAVNQRVCRLSPRNASGLFLFYALNRHPYLLAFDDGINQTHLRKEAVLDCPMVMPPLDEEQELIAHCFLSLDNQIGAETQKLDTLRIHKKGLMQQLFPSPEAVSE